MESRMETSLLLPLQLSDALFILEFFNSPSFIRFIGNRGRKLHQVHIYRNIAMYK
jgi:hypothetical protein